MVGRWIALVCAAAALAGCGESAPDISRASVTVKLPPARPYVPAPAFSFGHAPRAPH